MELLKLLPGKMIPSVQIGELVAVAVVLDNIVTSEAVSAAMRDDTVPDDDK